MSATSGDPGGPDDVDARFRSIIDAEFGPEAPTAHAPAPAPRASSEPFNLARALDEVTPDEVADPFEPPAGEPMPALRGRVLVGAVMLVIAGLLLIIAGIILDVMAKNDRKTFVIDTNKIAYNKRH